MPEHQPKTIPQESIARHHEMPVFDDAEPEILIEGAGQDDEELEITIGSSPNDADDDMEITVEGPKDEDIIELKESELQEVRPSSKPPLPPEHVIFERKKTESRWKNREPETEKNPLSEAEIKSNPTLKSLEAHVPAAYKEYLSFGEVLRNAGLTNKELRNIKDSTEFGNLLAQADYESSKALFEAGFAPDDQTYIVNQGNLPHYREELTLSDDKTAITGRRKRDTSEFIARIKKEDAAKAAALEKMSRQKTYLLAIGSALSRKAMMDFGKKES